MVPHLLVADTAIEVLVHCLDELKHLVQFDREAHSLQHLVEFVHFDVAVAIVINLLKDL